MSADLKQQRVNSGASYSFEMKIPKLEVKWSQVSVLPDNEVKPNEIEVVLEGDSTFPTSRDTAEFVIWSEHNHKTIETITALKLAENKITLNSDNTRPVKKFNLSDGIWDQWDQLNYQISGKVDTAESDSKKALIVKRWHVQAINNNERPAILAFRNQESANYDNSFSGCADDVNHSWFFDANNSSAAAFAKMMKNTYSFNYTGHGNVVCGVCNNEVYDGIETGTDAEFGRFTHCPNDNSHNKPKSAHCVGPFPWIQRNDIKDITPNTPKYLAYSVCCGGAFESSLFNAYIAMGTKYAIGFKKSTRCDWARDYSQQLFNKWIQTHGADPEKIPEVFNALYTTWSVKLEPVLFGKYWGIGSRLRDLGRSIASIF
ncbi:MAG: hypothetical protein COB83_09890 [Gammaproteobacteria bacterium]|nr:MAG: hypothetical protein COB83_09890 [Gammaproteobacteria bacterium]